MGDRAGKNVRYNSPPRRVADPVRGRYVGHRIEFPAATQAIIDAEGAAARARGEDYLIPLRFMPETFLTSGPSGQQAAPVNLQRERRHEPAYMRVNRAAARAAAAAAEEEEDAAAPAAAAAVAAPAVAAPAVAAPAVAAPAAANNNNNNNNLVIRRVKRSRPGNKSRKARKNRKSRKSRN